MKYNKKNIQALAKSGGLIILDDITQLIELYINEEKPKVKIVLSENNAYISLASIGKVQFIIHDIKNENDFSFIEEKQIVNLTKSSQSFIIFFLLEFWQGKSLFKKIWHLFYTFLFIIFINYLLLKFGTDKNLQYVFSGVLSAESIFIAIFSIFVANSDHFKNVKKVIFQNGKLAYYFSIDKNITICGLLAIFSSIIGLLVVGDNATSFSSSLHIKNWQDLFHINQLIFLLFNISFLNLFLSLRSLHEFYVIRPSKFMLGELKDEFLKEY